jgi:DNA helicase-2/ATP-dependent DNA helicase PcrA
MFSPRPKQKEVLKYQRGKMGVSAVPGSGKTTTLSLLAARIIASGVLQDDQEVLIVTLVNSAVDNFAHKVGQFIQESGLLPNLGYRVRTLHGLAHDIVRERPSLVGLADNFDIVDERAAEGILQDAALTWLRSNPYVLDSYLSTELEEDRLNWVRRDQLPELANSLGLSFIRYAKDLQISPEALRQKMDILPVPLPLAEMGCAIYTDYQRALAYRGAVDFDDLIRLALVALETDELYLERLQERWPYILEDEAQDSSRLQEQILTLLVGERGNWVRVGDPNQAIYETFTTANPKFLRNFLRAPGVTARELPDSGRSTRSIIHLANELIRWVEQEHPTPEVRQALTKPYIRPVSRKDPQPNPSDDPSKVQFIGRKFTPQEEIKAVADSLARWLPDHPDETVAVLVPRNQRGFELVSELKERGIEYEEILRSTSSTRASAGALGAVIACVADPASPAKLTNAYKAWRRDESQDEGGKALVTRCTELLRKCRRVEDYLWPHLGRDWLQVDLATNPDDGNLIQEELYRFGELARRWHGTALLPIDQAILTIAQDLFTEPADLAIAHKLAAILRQASEAHSDWRLPELSEELSVISRNERRFLGFSQDDVGFDPEAYRGKALVTTIHKAKGLEWDRVYLMSINNYDFPSGESYDTYIAERWYVRDHLNLEAEALQQLESAFSTDPYTWYEEGRATQEARLDYVSERLRLLYVGITRARRELVMTWNTGRRGESYPATAFSALQGFWERQLTEARDDLTG